MGMYTELNFNFELKSSTPQKVINTIKYMLDNNLREEFNPPPPPPEHELFNHFRWLSLMNCSSSYFETPIKSELKKLENNN